MMAARLGKLRLEGPGGVVLMILGGAVVGILCGRVAISHYGQPAVEAAAGLPLLFFLSRRPLLACLVLLALASSVLLYTTLPRIPLPGHPPLNVADLLLMVVVVGAFWRRPVRTWPGVLGIFVIGLSLLVLLALFPTVHLAVQGHSQAREAIAGLVDLLYLSAVVPVVLELRGRYWWPVLNTLTVLAAVIAVMSILAAASGRFGAIFAAADPNSITPIAGTTSRIRLPGLLLVYAMAIPTLVLVLTVKDRWRTLRGAALFLMLAAIGVSLNRNMYFGGAAGLLVTLLLAGTRVRYRVFVVLAIAATVAALAVQAAAGTALTSQVSSRAQSALSTQVLSSGSLETRATEFAHAVQSIRRHPLFGIGWDQNYGDIDGAGIPRVYVEDWYLDAATDFGLPVAIMFLVLVVGIIAYSGRRVRRVASQLDRGIGAALVGALVALLLSAGIGTYLQDPGTMLAFAFMAGLTLAAGVRTTVGKLDHKALMPTETTPVGD